MVNKNATMAMMSCSMNDNLSIDISDTSMVNMSSGAGGDTGVNTIVSDFTTTGGTTMAGWTYWTDHYYPMVIRESYPVYIQERACDRGKQAYEIIKILKDKKLVKLGKVSDFIDLMDELIKIL